MEGRQKFSLFLFDSCYADGVLMGQWALKAGVTQLQVQEPRGQHNGVPIWPWPSVAVGSGPEAPVWEAVAGNGVFGPMHGLQGA